MAPANRTRDRRKHTLLNKLKRRTRLIYLKILRIDDPPEKIARGAAIGVAIGILPSFGLGGFIAFGLAFVFKANKASAVLGSFIMNPITAPFFWSASIFSGSVLFGERYSSIVTQFKEESYASFAKHAGIVYLTGNAATTLVFALLTYFLIKKLITEHRAHKKAQRELRRDINNNGL